MRVFIALFAALAVAQGSLFDNLFDQNGVRTTFGFNPMTSFKKIPTTCEEAIEEKWIAEEVPDFVPLKGLTFYCYPDKKVCIFYDDTCYFAGMQIALDKDKYTNCDMFANPAVMESRGYTNWTTRVNGKLTESYSIRYYTTDKATMNTSAADRIAARKSDRILQNGFIDVEGPGGITRIPTSRTEIEKQGKFLKQAHIIWMGLHFYFNMSRSATCTSENLHPYFPLTHYEEIVAMGLMNFGNYTFDEGETVWFEAPDRRAVEMIVPDGPECLYEMVEKCGLTTMHTYFVPNPYSIISNT